MIAIETPFPHVGSHCFERATGRKLTIIQRGSDGRILCRRDDKPRGGYNWNGPASGNVTLAEADLAETAEETAFAAPESSRTIAGKPRQSRKAKRPARGMGGAK